MERCDECGSDTARCKPGCSLGSEPDPTPEPEVEETPLGVFDAFLRQCIRDCVEGGSE